ncbi:TadE/TadG family type IV pilus assembly protein [Nitrosomonas sp. Nm58]|uniref:TadE/TadG family type IV pilus assembly protein n=1 Tax=Nitrosomonas sp. Nm58 TaxID=200126 RepID=UPI00089CB5C6|nr:TadE/TadG family type IV pilus assembly protein [Nitrosomonas sp. Nm58]SDY66731.1 TadE-like protein [Nitrosomonas sp. Nm58]
MKVPRQFNPKPASAQRFSQRAKQRGVAAVEFALIASLLFTLLLGVMEMSRVLFYWNTATEATRLGARLAVVCDQNAVTTIKSKMEAMLGVLKDGNITVDYLPSGCGIDTCRSVTVSITGLTVSTVIPLVPLNITMPPFTTTLPRESMNSANPDCALEIV